MNIALLYQILNTLQEAAARQTDEDWRKYGARELNISIQNTKKLIREAEEAILLQDSFECDEVGTSLGLYNLN
jgi:hypothetical protein